MAAFTPPGPEEQASAIGPTMQLSATLRRGLEPHGDFAALPVPGPNHWLANHPEPGPGFADFVRSVPHRPDDRRRKLYLHPLRSFIAGGNPALETLQKFALPFFTLAG